jgi:hypothetical protein
MLKFELPKQLIHAKHNKLKLFFFVNKVLKWSSD